MLGNYLTIAVRNLRRHPGYAAINVLGLAIGMACCLVMLSFVRHETSFDRFHDRADDIYRIALDFTLQGQSLESAMTPWPLARTSVEEFPEVEVATRLFREGSGSITIRRGSHGFMESGVLYADSNFFDVFSFRLTKGNPETALLSPYAVVLTESSAEKYFGDEDPLGKTVVFREASDRDEFEYTVTGVVEDPPANSHARFDFLASYVTQQGSRLQTFLGFGVYTYVRLRPDADPRALEAKFPALFAKYAGPQVQEAFGTSLDQFEQAGNRYRYFLQPLTSIHLHSDLDEELEPNGSALITYLFAFVAGFILLLACINFVNLATARAARRATEVGIRKALGSGQGQLVRQFLTESTLMSAFAVLLSLGAVRIASPWLSTLVGQTDVIPVWWMVLPAAIGLALLAGAGAGFYPAFHLASLRPVAVLKGAYSGRRRSRMRDSLVVVQFTISIALIAGTITASSQTRFLLNRDLGYDPEQVVVLEGAEIMGPQAEAFREALRGLPRVLSVTNSEKVPGRLFNGSAFRMASDPQDQVRMMVYTYASYDFVQTLGLNLTAGRTLSRERPGDSLAVLLNESAVRYLGLDDPIGQRLEWPGESIYEIVGIVDDFHISSLHEPIQPLALLGPDPRNTNRPNLLVSVRIDTRDLPNTLAEIESTWKDFAPQQPFVYSFLKEDVAAFYVAERRMSRLITLFTSIALLLACCGLFGLSAHAAEQRTKEIGIRKIVGASARSIVGLLSKDFLRLVLIAVAMALPISYFVLSRWLESFAYRIEIGAGIFLAAAAAALIIALATASYHAIKSALADPVKSLKYE